MNYLPKDFPKESFINFDNGNFNLFFNKYVEFDDKNKANIKKFTNIKLSKPKEIEDYYILLKQLNMNFTETVLANDWRTALGLGSASVYETSITLHHIYGIPYIPGQSLKGVIRSYIISEKFDNKENEAFKDEGFCYIFGSSDDSELKEHKGSVIFFDSYPIDEKIEISLDIMNPHYGEYYNDKENIKPPADYYNPVPVEFLTLKNAKFRFILGLSKNFNKNFESKIINSKESIIEQVMTYLKEALEFKGIGSKTSVGYGYFEEDEEYKKQQEQLKIQEQKKQKEEEDKRRKEEEQKKLDSMSEVDKFIFGLNKDNINDKFKEIVNFKDEDLIRIAEKFKEIYKNNNKWEGKQSDKQNIKNNKIKEILKE